MKKIIILICIISCLYNNQAVAQKTIFEASIGKKVNLEDYINKAGNFFCSTGELAVLPFSQTEGTWCEETMQICLDGTIEKIGEVGCALTCMTMLLHSHGEMVTPFLLNNYLKSSIPIGYEECALIKWDVACNYGTSTVEYSGYSTFDYNKLKLFIDSQNPVIMAVNNLGHFVIITGYDNDGTECGDYTILDPDGGVERRLSYYEDDCIIGTNILRVFSSVNAECIFSNPPLHCFNCFQDGDLGELDIDCGGDCPPCGESSYSKLIESSESIEDVNFAFNIIDISPESQQIDIEGDKVFLTSEQILLKPPIKIPSGSNIEFSLSDNRNNLTRDCDDPCIFFSNVIGPTQDWYAVAVTNVEHIYMAVVSPWGITTEYSIDIHHDGINHLFEKSDFPAGVYFYYATVYACDGDEIDIQGSLTIFYSSDNTQTLIDNNYKPINMGNNNFEIFPKPCNNHFYITTNEIIKSIKLFNLNGINESIIVNYISLNKIEINTMNLKPGVYVVYIFTNNGTRIEKIIKM